jgi:peptidoglycan/LPS O-acetylase OafA/YrhL
MVPMDTWEANAVSARFVAHTNQPQRRLTSLDAVRGIASCAVVLSHCYLILPEQQRPSLDGVTWARLLLPLYNGNAAVVIFFALSGYVLSLPYLSGNQLPYLHYLVRRGCRIYIPFAVSIVMAMALFAATSHAPTANVSLWFNELWPTAWPSTSTIAGHFLMVGTSRDMQLNPPMWTLVYELRLSLMFPLLVLFCRNTGLAVAVSLVMLVGSVKLIGMLGQVPHPSFATDFGTTLLWTAHIIPYFVTGILLSKHRAWISLWLRRMPSVLRLGLFGAAFAIFCMPPSFGSAKENILYTIAAALMIVLAIESRGLCGLLESAVPQYLGRISYSLYLVHLPITLVLVPALIDRVPFALLVVIIIAVSLAAASVMHKLIEIPSIKLGHRLARRARQQQAMSGV